MLAVCTSAMMGWLARTLHVLSPLRKAPWTGQQAGMLAASTLLSQEKQKLLDEIEELSLRLSDEQENRRKLGDRLSHERHQFQRDKEATQEVSMVRPCPET